MATLITLPLFRVFDGSGAPLAGGKLYFYEAGTTTPKDTYADSGEVTPNTNPVILDAEGYAEVWGVGTYKVVIKDADDVTLQTVDDINIPGLPGLDGGGADDGKLLAVDGSEYALTDTLTDFKIRRFNHVITYTGDVPAAMTFDKKVYFTQNERLHSIKPFLGSGTATIKLSKNGSGFIDFGVSPADTVAVTTTPTTSGVNNSGVAYVDFSAGDYLEISTTLASGTDLVLPLNTTENYS